MWFFPADRGMFSRIVYRLLQRVLMFSKIGSTVVSNHDGSFLLLHGSQFLFIAMISASRPTSIFPPPFVEYLFMTSHIFSFSNISCAVPLHHQNPVLLLC